MIDDYLVRSVYGTVSPVKKWEKAKTFEDTAYFEPDYLKAFSHNRQKKYENKDHSYMHTQVLKSDVMYLYHTPY